MITIDWATLTIFVPKSYMAILQSTPFEIRLLDVDVLRKDLKGIEDSFDGMAFQKTHTHNTEIIISGISYARSVEILSPYTVEFEDGQYGVSLIGANNNILDVKVPNQVSLLGNNSAGLINSEALNNQSYLLGRVYINTVGNGASGTTYPKGTPTDPSDNWEDASTIRANNKLSAYNIRGSIIYSGANPSPYASYSIYGESPINSNLFLDGRSSLFSIFTSLTLFGVLDGRATFNNCVLSSMGFDLSGFDGFATDCALGGKITLDTDATEDIAFTNCVSSIAGVTKPEIDCNDVVSDIEFRNYQGGIKITNFTSGNNMSIDSPSGSVEVDPSCTAGNIVIRGTVDVMDNSGAGCTVIYLTPEGGGGDSVWTEGEKDQVVSDSADAKRQATIAAMNSQTVKQV